MFEEVKILTEWTSKQQIVSVQGGCNIHVCTVCAWNYPLSDWTTCKGIPVPPECSRLPML